jgi:hypothetical protein
MISPIGKDLLDTAATPRPCARRIIEWIETYCTASPAGDRATLSIGQRAIIERAYGYRPEAPLQVEQIDDPTLLPYLVLLHLCGPEASIGGPLPDFQIDPQRVWLAAGVEMLGHLRFDSGVLVCPRLRTRFPND